MPEAPQTPEPVGPKRDDKGRLLPGGPSLNAGGDPSWLRDVRAKLRAGSADAAEYLVRVVNGKEVTVHTNADGEDVEVPVQPRDRIAAAKVIFEYTVPKPKQEVEVNASTGETSELRREVLTILAGLDS